MRYLVIETTPSGKILPVHAFAKRMAAEIYIKLRSGNHHGKLEILEVKL